MRRCVQNRGTLTRHPRLHPRRQEMQKARRRALHKRSRALRERTRQNKLTPEHIAKIIETAQFRKEESRYSTRVEMDEIETNNLNLNIFRYISIAVPEGTSASKRPMRNW